MDWHRPLSSLSNAILDVVIPWYEWLLLIYGIMVLTLILTCSTPPIINIRRLKRQLWQKKGIERRKSRVMTAPPKGYLK